MADAKQLIIIKNSRSAVPVNELSLDTLRAICDTPDPDLKKSEETDFTPVHWDGSSMEWRKIIGSPFCSLPSGHKHVLTTMARYGDKWGDSIFPSQREIAFRAGVTAKCVNQVVRRAEREGWIIRYFIGGGRGYRRTTYSLSVPAGVFYATARLKAKFWEPPYEYILERQDDKVSLVKRPPT